MARWPRWTSAQRRFWGYRWVLGEGASRVTEAEVVPITVLLEGAERVRELVLRVNGTPIYRFRGEQVARRMELEAPLGAGQNVITAHVRSEAAWSGASQPVSVLRVGEEEPSRLYIFAAGVSDYRDNALDLNYAAKDARDVAAYLQSVSSDVVAKVVADGEVDRSVLAEARTFFREARPGDRAILFLAGHGFLSERLDYFFAPYAFDTSSPETSGFTMEDIDSVFDGSVVLNRAILIDSCHAGDFDEDRVSREVATLDGGLSVRGTRGLTAARGGVDGEASSAYRTMRAVFADLNTRSGAHVIAASGGLEYSVEGPSWNNGVFTYSVLEALKSGEGDLDGDGLVEIRELGARVSKSVSILTGFRQVPSSRSANISNNFVVTAVAGR